ncbi:MAG: pyridoxamine 5'-phosphate oxidase [Bacteroidetes bacterium]|nr:pyridoxamine 5'-phosphate oxidase [Bacteroidota bacterium]
MAPENYDKELHKSDLDPNPIVQFNSWLQEAADEGIKMPERMNLATSTKDGNPSSRMMLLKGADERGFTFFSNYNSQKAREIEENPHVALNFFWYELQRQVRIIGTIEKISEQESDEYFSTRPFESQLGAVTSSQSKEIRDRKVLENKYRELQKQYKDGKVPRPKEWGGYRVTPSIIEFWQGRTNRLHDRLVYSLQKDQSWNIVRLAP